MIYTWNLNPIALSVMGLEIRWYGLAYILGFFLALHLGWHYWQQQKLGTDKKVFENFVFSTFMAGIIGGRLGLFLFYSPLTLITDPLEIFQVWHGGMSIHGGVLGATLWGLWQCKKLKLEPLKVADIFMLPLAIGLFLGRITNFINGELYGRVTDQNWGVIFPHVDGLMRHPSQLYEASKNLLLVTIIYAIIRKGGFKKPGLITAIMLIGYGVLRFMIEFFREPESYIGLLTTGQALCVVLITIGAGILYQARLKSK